MTHISLSEHFTYQKLLRFSLPSIVMMVLTSIYGVVDGIFVSNYAGVNAFAGLNFIYPYCMIVSAFSFMIGSGSSALIGKLLGEKNDKKANEVFSLSVYFSIVLAVITMGLGLILIEPITIARNATGELLKESLTYGRIFLCGNLFLTIQMEFQNLFVTAEKPKMGFVVTTSAGLLNVALDALFIIGLKWGVAGAAWATIIAQGYAAAFSILYFSLKNSSRLRLGKTTLDFKAIGQICFNGISELLSNIAMSIIGLLYNNQLLKYAGENGISAYGALMYVSFIYIAIFIGFVIGVAPIFSYHFGAKNHRELTSLLRKSLVIIFITSIIQVILAEVLARTFAALFVGYDTELMNLTIRAFKIYSFGFVLAGFCIFTSCFFTALNDGLSSMVVSLSRTLIFQIVMVYVCPLLWEVDGIWASYVFAEILSGIVCFAYLFIKRKKFGYSFLIKQNKQSQIQ